MDKNAVNAQEELNEEVKLPFLLMLMSKVKIGARITIIFLFIICAISLPSIIMISQSVKFMNTYNNVLDNLDSINYIMEETQQQGDRIIGYCAVNKNIEESGETEIIVKMQDEIEKIRENIGTDKKYEKNLQRLEIVENLMNNYVEAYKEGLSLCGDTFSLSGDTKFYSMVNTSQYLSKNCSELLSLELQRSSDLKEGITSDFTRTILSILIVVVIIIIVSILLATALTRSITLPIKILGKNISVIAKGDLSGRSINIATKDEIHDLSEAFNLMKNNLKHILQEVSGVTGEIEESVNFVTERVEDNSANSQEISATVDVMLQHLEQQNGETSDAQEGMNKIDSVSVRISENANRIMYNAEKSLLDSQEGNEKINLFATQLEDVNAVMNEVSVVVKELDNSTKEMNDIINTITEISEQTNLLSLNAAIEAARAGESGRGFSVVASEISDLADHSNVSAQKIGDIIAEVQDKANSMTEKMRIGLKSLDEGNKIANDTRQSFDNIRQGIQVVNENVKEIIQNITELSEHIKTILVNMDTIHDTTNNNVSVTTQIVSNLHEQTDNLVKVADIMNDLSKHAKQLEETVLKFKLN